MSRILTFISDFLTNNQDANNRINVSLLIIVLVGLLIALYICIIISKKNQLYGRKKKLETIDMKAENEVA